MKSICFGISSFFQFFNRFKMIHNWLRGTVQLFCNCPSVDIFHTRFTSNLKCGINNHILCDLSFWWHYIYLRFIIFVIQRKLYIKFPCLSIICLCSKKNRCPVNIHTVISGSFVRNSRWLSIKFLCVTLWHMSIPFYNLKAPAIRIHPHFLHTPHIKTLPAGFEPAGSAF